MTADHQHGGGQDLADAQRAQRDQAGILAPAAGAVLLGARILRHAHWFIVPRGRPIPTRILPAEAIGRLQPADDQPAPADTGPSRAVRAARHRRGTPVGPMNHRPPARDDTMEGMRARVLVVDDDPALAEMLTIVLRGEGFEPAVVRDGSRALDVFREVHPDLVLLDLMLPGMSGLDVCKQIRAESGIPIIMLTAKTDTVDVVLGLESGADDYVMKPFKPKELTARIRARLRRADVGTAERLRVADVEIDVPGHQVTRGGEPISLTPAGVRPAGRAWPANPARCSPARCCSNRSGAIGTPPTPGWSTCTCSGCGRRSRRDPEHPEVVVTVRGVGYRAGVS